MPAGPQTLAEAAAHPSPVRARVVVQAHLGLLDYAVPPELTAELSPGTPVRVELGRRATSGYYVGPGEGELAAGVTLKPLLGLDPDRPALPPVLMDLVAFAAAHYLVPAGELLGAVLPARARTTQLRHVLTPAGKVLAQQVMARAEGGLDPGDLLAQGEARPKPAAAAEIVALLRLAAAHPRGFALPAVVGAHGWSTAKARRLVQASVARGELMVAQKPPPTRRQEATYVHQVGADPAALGPRQARARALFDHLPEGVPVALSALRRIDAQATRLVRALLRYGLVAEGDPVAVTTALPDHADAAWAASSRATRPTLTANQAEVMDALLPAIAAGGYGAFLLHGVTGSGKTEVYLRAIEATLARGKTALVLVPEIALTPQLGARFRARFGDKVATLHSGLTAAERQRAWERVASGEAVIGLGARSALFLPLRQVGVVVVDEEHEGSFKQDESPRYHARDLAVWRARAEGAVVVLGSATPSLESWHNASRGRYRLLQMASRVAHRPLPKVEVVAMQESARVGSGLFTEQLHRALAETFGRGEQAILFLNRRGFAPYVFCRDCGHSFRCQDCDVSLTLHQRRGRLLCHYCGEGEDAPDACPSCQGNKVESFGLGTERIEAEVRALFPEVKLARLDRDTVRRRQDLEHVLSNFRRGEAQLLVGTQMVAKGHDFPNVTLVGAVAADASLNFPDFRAAERTFQLLAQVAGRAGRGERPGRVIVQAYEHGHYAVVAASQHDYGAFVAEELEHRRELGYPPFGFVVRLRYESPSEKRALAVAEADASLLQAACDDGPEQELGAGVTLLGPAPAPLARLRGSYRFHTLLKAPSRQLLQQVLRALPRYRHHPEVRCIVDVDPVNML